jgi:hypothetical protein
MRSAILSRLAEMTEPPGGEPDEDEPVAPRLCRGGHFLQPKAHPATPKCELKPRPPCPTGSGANLKGSVPSGNGWDDGTDLSTGSLQGPTFRPRNHHPVYQVVPDVQTQLP